MQLEIENLSVRRGGLQLIAPFNLSISDGESVAITGPNGVGKTTLLRLIAGFIEIEKGRIELSDNSDNEDVTRAELIHYIGHKNGIRPSLTVLENLQFWRDFFESDVELAPILKKFNLSALKDIPSGYLSAGQKRRACLARIALKKRPLWLLDEPNVSLDQNSTRTLSAFANDHLSAGGMLITATHIPLDIEFSKSIELEPDLSDAGASDDWSDEL